MPFVRWDRRLFDAGQRLPLVGPCLLVLLATLVFRFTDADLTISRLFYDGVSGTGFPLAEHPVVIGLYYGGLVPVWLLGLGSLAVLAISAFRDISPSNRRAAFFLLALLAVAPVMLVNVVYKGHWGRPRPDETIHFGGSQPFLHVLEKGPGGSFHSFPSGHAAAGFCVIAPAFLLYRRHRRWAIAWFASGLACGLIVGMGRIVQGRHFGSDMLWAAAMVYFSGCALDYLILSRPTTVARSSSVHAERGRHLAPARTRAGQRKAPTAPSQPAKPRREAA